MKTSKFQKNYLNLKKKVVILKSKVGLLFNIVETYRYIHAKIMKFREFLNNND